MAKSLADPTANGSTFLDMGHHSQHRLVTKK